MIVIQSVSERETERVPDWGEIAGGEGRKTKTKTKEGAEMQCDSRSRIVGLMLQKGDFPQH